MRASFKTKAEPNINSIIYYPFKQEIPRAIPKILASLIMQENSDPMFLRNEVTFCKFVSLFATCIIIIN